MKNLYRNFRKVRIIQLVILMIVFGQGNKIEAQTNPIPSPTSFRAAFASHNSVKLVWAYSGEAADSFVIERKINSGNFAQLTTVTGTSNTYTNTGLTVGSTYTYRIKTKKGTVFSATTREVSIKIPDNKSFIPSELQITPEGIASFSPIEMVIPWTTFATGNTFDVFQTPPCLTGQYYIGFELSYDLGDFNTESDWKADLQISFLDNGVTKWTKPLSISSLSGTWTGVVFHDVALSCGGDYKFKIHTKTETGAVPGAQVRLKEKLYKKVNNTFNPVQIPSLTVSYSANVANLNWTAPNMDFREYDLEWVFISSHDVYTTGTAAGAFAHREGVGVRLSSNNYTHPIYYPSGRLYYRVRAVGYNPDFPDRKILGNWSYGPNTGTVISNQQTAYNWQVRTDFIEGGRYKKTVSYLDGTMRPRQQISTLSGGAYTVVSDTWYDFEGREAVQFLPSPDPSTSLRFRPNFNRFNNTVSQIIPEVDYTGKTKNKFHYDNGIVANNTLQTTYGVGKYYSSANTMSMVNKNYLPQAAGYGAVFTEYLSDPTGRVKKQSQPGSRFKVDGANTTRKFYAQAFPEELIRLFGSNVGEAVHYRKEVIVDPNDQASVQYINQEGQVVATALAGNSPLNVTPLAEYTARQNAGWGAVVYDLISHNKPQGSSKLVDASFVNTTANTPYTFAYALTGIGSDLDQVGCESCEFTLSMSLVDPDGLLVTLPSISGDEEPLAEIFKKTFTATDCQVNTDFSPVNISLDLPKIGEYRIIKELKVKEKSYSEIISEIRSSSTFQQEKLAVENAAGQDLGDCEICDEVSPEAVEAIVWAVDGVVDAELGGVYAQIREQVLAGMTAEQAADPAAVESAIMGHPDYCRYELMERNKGARKFELELVQISTMSQAIAKGYYPIQNADPFYKTGGIGQAHYSTLANNLGNINLGNGFSGSLPTVINPYSTSMRVSAPGRKDPNGFHILYYELFRKRQANQLTEQQLQTSLDSAQWQMYSSLYSKTSREVKKSIAALYQCPAFMNDLQQGDELPTSPDGATEWANQKELEGPVSEEELDQVVAMVQSKCSADFTGAQLSTIKNSLQSYFNQERAGNFFNLILIEDLNNALLAPMANILQSKGCSLTDIATPNPLICQRDSVIQVPIGTGGGLLPECNWMQVPTPMFSSNQSIQDQKVDMSEGISTYEEALDQYAESIGEQHQEELLMELKTATAVSKSGTMMSTMSDPLPSQAEYNALMDLYQATNGVNWLSKSGWSTANPNTVQSVKGWTGIYVDANGHVTHLILNYNNLSGQLPSSLQSLVHLQYFQVAGNNLPGPIPTWLNAFTELTNLSLTESKFTGTIPSQIGELVNLEELALHRNSLVGEIPPSFTNLTKLRWLRLYDNHLTGGIPEDIDKLVNLEYLYMYRNDFSGPIPPSIGSISTLKFLGLHTNSFSGELPQSLGNLTNLNTLLLHYNDFSGNIPASLGNLTKMENISFYSNRFTGTLPNSLGNFNKTHTFFAHDNLLEGFIPESFGNMTSLRALRLDNNKLTGEIPATLGNILTLEDLRLHNNQLSGSIPESFCNLPVINWLYLYNNNLGGSLPFCLFSKNLSVYWLSMNYYTCDALEANAQYFNTRDSYWPQKAMQQYEDITVCVEYELDPSENPWLASVSYVPDWEDVVERCLAEREVLRTAIRAAAVEELEDQWVESYFRSVSTSCMEDASESLNMTVTNKEYHYTLYYYDQANNLVQTVPPKGVKPLTTAQINQVKSGTAVHPDHELPTRYRYNSKNQLVWQSSPDGGVSQFWYNAIGQLRLSQNAKQAAVNAYSYSKYDRLGRVIESGELITEEEQAVLKEKLRELDFPQRPTYACQDITITGYDNRKTGLHLIFSQDHLRNRVSFTAQLEKGKTDTLLTAYSYDPHGNVKSLLQQVPGLAPKITSYKYDQISGNVNYVFYQPGTAEQLIHHYTYDADNRIETVQTSTDGHLWSTDATYYYYPHGPLARVELGEHKVQGMDYYYTLQGWLKGVNMPGGGDPGGDGTGTMRTGKDAMAFALGYYSGDYAPITTGTILTDSRDALWTRNSTVSGNTGLYNGNISWMNTELAGSQDDYDMQAMLYKYDQLHRIVQARSLREYSSSFTSRNATAGKPYDVDYTYDANGNLLTLKRHDSQSTLLHDFNYEYYPGTNRLRKVVGEYSPVVPDTKVYNSNPLVPDGQPYRVIKVADGAVLPSGQSAVLKATERIVLQPGSHIRSGSTFSAAIEAAAGVPIPPEGQYGYDAIGNLISDNGEGITNIEWTPSGKVRKVVKSSGDPIEFRYDASGNRVEKKQGTTVTGYIRDASGNVMAVYQNNLLLERPIYGSSRLGQLDSESATGYRTVGLKKYELSNHLGNVLAVVSDRIHMDSENTWTDVISRSDYYPFGMAMGGRTESSSYRYGFNGKELDSPGTGGGGNTYDYGFRIYNPEIAKFLSMDPIASNFPYLSPYQFAGLDPIKYIDLDGLERAYIDPRSGYIIPASDFHQHTPPPGAIFLNDGPSKKELDKSMNELRTVGSFIPVLDWAIDGQDAYNDFSNGNYLLGSLSVLSFIPGADFMTKPMKLALKNADKLRDALKITDKSLEAHHIIPTQLLKENKLVQDAVSAGFEFNGEINGIAVKRFRLAEKSGQHANHPAYTDQIRTALDRFIKDNKDYTPNQAREFLEDFSGQLRNRIQGESVEGGKKINDLIIR